MRFMERCDGYFEDFLRVSRCDESEIYGWRPALLNELLIYMNDGDVYSYNCLTQESNFVVNRFNRTEDNTKDSIISIFAMNLKRALNIRSISQRYLAEKTGISPSAINKYVKGQASPSFSNSLKIARVLEVSISDLSYFDFDLEDWGGES